MAAPRPLSSMPGPRPRFLVGELPAFRRAMPWEVCAAYAREHGPLTRIQVLGNTVVVMNDAEAIGDVLEREADRFYKDRPRDALLPISSDSSAFASPGGEHWAARRQAMPHSHAGFGAWLARQVPAMQAVVRARLDALARGGRGWDAVDELLRLAFDVGSVAFVGRELGDDAFRAFLDLATLGDRRLRWRLPFGAPWGRAGDEALRRWLGVFLPLVAEARRSIEGRDDLLAFQLRSGTTASDETLAYELANNYFGGCFSMTTGIVVTLYELTAHPAERERLQAALRPLVDGSLDARALLAHEPLDHALREALRLRPPVAFFVRRVKPDADAELGGYTIPASTTLFLSCFALHRDPARWGADADRFRPARWAGGVAAENPYGSGYFFPFGRGPRTCAGEAFAHVYMKLVLATMLGEHAPEVGAGQPFEPEMFFAVMRPKGLVARLGAIRAAASA